MFDFDGTLARGESFGTFLRFAVAPTRRVTLAPVAAPVVLAYRRGLVSGVRTRAAITWLALRNTPLDVIRERAKRFARDVIPSTIRPEARRRLDWHRARGDRVMVVSGAYDIYLRPWCEREGLECEASHLQTRDGLLTGFYEGLQCVGATKQSRIESRVNFRDFEAIHAYGDTSEDREMLELATHPHFREMPPADTST